jgi:hypothetical protein
MYGGNYKSIYEKGRKNLSDYSQGLRPYSAIHNILQNYENPYMYEQEDLVKANDFNEENQGLPKKRRPNTAKTRSMQDEEAKHISYVNYRQDSSESMIIK